MTGYAKPLRIDNRMNVNKLSTSKIHKHPKILNTRKNGIIKINGKLKRQLNN